MSGVLGGLMLGLSGGPLLTTTITAASSSIVSKSTTSYSYGPFLIDSGTIYGYDAVANDGYFEDWTGPGGWSWWNLGDSNGFGSIEKNTFTDHSAVSRTIVQLAEATSFGADYLVLSLSGTSIPNTDSTFEELEVGGVTVIRSDANYTASYNGSTHWYWANPGAIVSLGVKDVVIR